MLWVEFIYGMDILNIMSQAMLEREQTLFAIPAEVESTLGKLVYLYVTTVDRTNVDGLVEALDVSHLNIVPTIDHLCDEGLLRRDGDAIRLARRE